MGIEKITANIVENSADSEGFIRKKNAIQRELMSRSGDPMMWIEKNAANLDKIIRIHRSLMDDFETDREKAIHDINAKLAEYDSVLPKAA